MRGLASFIVVVYGMDLQQPYPPLQERFKAPDVLLLCLCPRRWRFLAVEVDSLLVGTNRAMSSAHSYSCSEAMVVWTNKVRYPAL